LNSDLTQRSSVLTDGDRTWLDWHEQLTEDVPPAPPPSLRAPIAGSVLGLAIALAALPLRLLSALLAYLVGGLALLTTALAVAAAVVICCRRPR